MNKALIDTDILSEMGKGIDPKVTQNATDYRSAFGRYTLSTITVMEVVRGFQKNQSPRRLQAFLTSIAGEEILPFGEAAAELAGRIAGGTRSRAKGDSRSVANKVRQHEGRSSRYRPGGNPGGCVGVVGPKRATPIKLFKLLSKG